MLIQSLEPRLLFAFGDVDSTFGTNGKAIVKIPENTAPLGVQKLLVASDGKILAGGVRAGIARLNSDGSLDTTFGNRGRIRRPDYKHGFLGMAIDPSTQAILVLYDANFGHGFNLYRFNKNGKLDASFGTGGIVAVVNSNEDERFLPQAIAVQKDDKVIVAGVMRFSWENDSDRRIRVHRFNSSGTIDAKFGTKGTFEFHFKQVEGQYIYDQVADVRVLSGGKIDIIGGSLDWIPGYYDFESGDSAASVYGDFDFAVAQLTSSGTLNTSYGSNGVARATFASKDFGADSIDDGLPHVAAMRTDGSVLVAGLGGSCTVGEFDPTGKVKYVSSAGFAAGYPGSSGLTVLNDGRAVLTGGNPSVAMTVSPDGELGPPVTLEGSLNPGDTEGTHYGSAATAKDGGLLFAAEGSEYKVEKYLVGDADDPRPDDFHNGRTNALAVDLEGSIYLAYYDAASTHLMYARRDPRGLWSAAQVVDAGEFSGQYISIAVADNNRPGIAYFDGKNGDLKLAQFNGKKWSFETIDSKGSVGLYPSLQYTDAHEPVVTYYNKSKGTLTFALKRNNTTWGYENVDGSGNDVGRSSVLRPHPDTRRYSVAYVDNTAGSVKFASHLKGGKWDVRTAATTNGGADFVSMAYNVNSELFISYYDAFAADLKVTALENGEFKARTIAAKGTLGLYTVAIHAAFGGTASVFAYNRTKDKITLYRITGDVGPSDVVTGGGKYLSAVRFDETSGTTMVYFDSDENVLKVRAGPVVYGG